MPQRCTQEMALLKAVHTSECFRADLKKGTVHNSLVFAHMPAPALFCDVKVKKGALTLYPAGTIQSLKGKDLKKVKGVVVEYQSEHFLVQPYKAFKYFDDDSADGALIPYNFVGKTSEEMDVTISIISRNQNLKTIPFFLSNEKNVLFWHLVTSCWVPGLVDISPCGSVMFLISLRGSALCHISLWGYNIPSISL